ncbi:transaldolase family protein [Tetragenococcus koreensis]|uniref:transaldolase family protein n=1 Tax=Tetragenococcus koreensis TaxID=290335 RepID=UPI000F4FD347|nr:transaldolase family protein [Tetragenococcus koreensis]AYW46082.1 hypothetical protein C7K43_09200 [Tetragenococcus koreensis]GEN92174.1 transaldolase [Tetragenococcus koreensis]
MEYCLDTGSLDMVKQALGVFPINSVSMNPTIAAKDLQGKNVSFIENALMIREVIGCELPFFLEAMGDTAEEMVEDAEKVVKLVPGNTFVKIPACREGLKAIKKLKTQGIRTSCTAIYTFNQAMLAAEAGADYVAVYVSRLDKLGSSGVKVVKEIKKAFNEREINCKVCAASLKNNNDIEKALKAGAENIAVTLDLLNNMSVHPLTEQTLEAFKSDWESVFGKGIRIADM